MEEQGGVAKSHEELAVISKYKDGNIELIPNSQDKQWAELSSKIEIQSIFGHKILVNSLNNSTHLFFLLSWNDRTPNDNPNALKAATNNKSSIRTDGAEIIFESRQEKSALMMNSKTSAGANKKNISIDYNKVQFIPHENSTWYWSSPRNASLNANKGEIISTGEWKNNQWNVLIGKRISNSTSSNKSGHNENISSLFQIGILQKAFVRFAVWDGAKGESNEKIMTINYNDSDKILPHADFILLPSLNIHPPDVYMWSGILIVGVVLFVILEIRLHNSDRSPEQDTREKEEALP